MQNQNKEKRNFNNKNRNQKPRTKFEPVTFLKKFDNFEDGLDEVRKYNEYIDCIFVDYESDEDSKNAVKYAKKAIVYDLSENIPDFENENTKFQALNISSNKVSYKLSTGISFGWKSVYNKESGITYEFSLTALTYSELKHLRETIGSDWNVLERNK